MAAAEMKSRKRVPIVIPNAENMTPEELKKAKHAEKMRRYMNRKNAVARGMGEIDPGSSKKTNQEIRLIDDKELLDLTRENRNSILQVMQKKLVLLNDDPEQLAKMNLATLATAFGIMVDKANLMAGMATQNIAIHSKVDINMTSDEAIKELAKMRERFTNEE